MEPSDSYGTLHEAVDNQHKPKNIQVEVYKRRWFV